MNLEEFKANEVGKNIQTVLFNIEGEVLASDENLTELKQADFNVFDDTMFCGMEETFDSLAIDEQITFNCVNLKINDINSQFDLMVKRIPDADAQKRFGWVIFDYAKQYEKLLELQQERNMAEISYSKSQREANKLKDEKKAIETLYRNMKDEGNSQYILVKSDNLLVNLNLTEILYFAGYGDYVKVFTPNKMYITYNTLRAIENALPENQFFRIHRSFIVRLDKIKNIEQLSVEVSDKILPLGKNHKALLIEKIGQL